MTPTEAPKKNRAIDLTTKSRTGELLIAANSGNESMMNEGEYVMKIGLRP